MFLVMVIALAHLKTYVKKCDSKELKMKYIFLILTALLLVACTTMMENYNPKKNTSQQFYKDYGECKLQTNNNPTLTEACMNVKGWHDVKK